ncbi:39S ribosomal protein L36, mitochondrial [Halotydeus destructor]|nr:39S ribosomal protein L36, mitochondrial [Halotydeus destructor]
MSIFKLTGLLTTAISRLTLQPPAPLITNAIRTFKDKDVLRLRCKDCYFKKVDERWWVLCNSHPRHKQREHVEDIKRKYIVTHLTYGGRPFQKKEEAYICNLAPPGPFDYKLKLQKKNAEDFGRGRTQNGFSQEATKYLRRS